MTHRLPRGATLPLAVLLAALAAAPLASVRADESSSHDDLERRYQELEAAAKELAAAYREVMAERVDGLVAENPTLRYLHDVGIFTPEGLVAGLPREPLASLPWLKRALVTLDERAADLADDYADQANAHFERKAVRLMRSLHDAQEAYRLARREQRRSLTYAPDLETLAEAGLLELGAGSDWAESGYEIRVLHGDVRTYSAEAIPSQPGYSGEACYFVDQSGVVRMERGRRANRSSPPVD